MCTFAKERDNTKEMLEKYAGALDDDRSADSIIANIYNSRNSLMNVGYGYRASSLYICQETHNKIKQES